MSDAKYSPLGKLSAIQQMQVRLGSTGIRVSPLGIGVGLLLVLGIGYYSFVPQNLPMQSTPDRVSIKELLKSSIEFCERGGEVLVKIRSEADIGQESKGTHDDVAEGDIGTDDPVTRGDKESHKAMTFGFLKYFPNIHVVSEEHTDKPDLDTIEAPSLRNREVDRIITTDEFVDPDEITVWIDPLDATQEYTENLQQYVTTMVCIVRGTEPIAAVVHKPFSKTSAWAWVGHGTNLIDESSKAPDNSIIVSRSHAGGVADVAKAGLGDDVTVVPAGGAGYKAWSLFEGVAQAYVHTTLIKKWDICPGHALLRASGGEMSKLDGGGINYKYDSDEKHEGGMVSALHDYEKYQKALAGAFGA